MGSKLRKKVIQCPLHNRSAEVTYKIIGSWFNRKYDIQSCSAIHDGGGCDRQCKNQLAVSRTTDEWHMHN